MQSDAAMQSYCFFTDGKLHLRLLMAYTAHKIKYNIFVTSVL